MQRDISTASAVGEAILGGEPLPFRGSSMGLHYALAYLSSALIPQALRLSCQCCVLPVSTLLTLFHTIAGLCLWKGFEDKLD